MHLKVDEYLSKAKSWREEMAALRRILLDCQLTEEWKWRAPCYAYQNHNVAIIGELKDYCALSFFKGALLKDPQGLLSKPGENSRSGRLFRFTSVEEIVGMEAILKAYIQEAIEVEKAGLKVDFKKNAELPVPKEVQDLMQNDPDLKAGFNALTPGRRRGYLLHFSQPKQSATKAARVARWREHILAGKGMHDY